MTDDDNERGKLLHFPTVTLAPSTPLMSPAELMALRCEYRLVGHEAVPITDPADFARSFYERRVAIETSGHDPHRVAFTDLGGGLNVSTVFLGIDHSFFGGPPMLFETMVFGGPDMVDLQCERCSTWEQAEEQHKEVVSYVIRATGTNGK